MEFEAIISDIRIRNCAVKLAWSWLLRAEISLEIRRVQCPVTREGQTLTRDERRVTRCSARAPLSPLLAQQTN